MASVLKYPRAVSQYTGGDYREFSNLENIKNHTSGSYATSNGNIRAKTGSPKTPSTITATHFGFNLPVGAEVISVKVTIAHRVNKVGNTTCNIPASPIELLNVYGVPDKLLAAPSTSFGANHTYTFKHKNLTREVVNSADFGVRIKYKGNTGKYEGTLSVGFINVEVVYKAADFSVVASITNKNGVKQSPTCTISYPSDFDFDHAKGAGTFKVNPNTHKITWKPNVKGVKGTHYLEMVFYPKITYSGSTKVTTRTISVSENYTSKSASYTARIRKNEPITPESAPDVDYEAIKTADSSKLFFATRSDFLLYNDLYIDYTLTEEEWALIYESEQEGYPVVEGPTFYIENDEDLEIWDGSSYVRADEYEVEFDEETRTTSLQLIDSTSEYCEVRFRADYQVNASGVTVEVTRYISTFNIYFRPLEDDLSLPYCAVLELTEEEINRLGDGFTYIAQADMKHTTTDTFTRDWYKNNRIGVFNNAILDNVTITETIDPDTHEVTETVTDSTDYDNLTLAEIIENADYWSETVAGLNTYENVECEFTYDEDYPLYIIIAGDYTEASSYGFDDGSTSNDDVCIIEKIVYKNREPTGTYPVSIVDLIGDEDVSNLELEGYNSSSSFIVYDFDVDEDSLEDRSILGLEVIADLEHADLMSLNAKLVNSSGDYGQRSINLSDTSEGISIGGLGDLWGFNVTELANLKDFEVELNASGLIEDSTSTLTLNNVCLNIYTEPVVKQQEEVYIDGQPLSYYGCFIEKAIPDTGLNSDVAYLDIDGSDRKDAYRQNIDVKKINLEFYIEECDFNANTKLLDIVTELIVNKRDKYNRPIPNMVELSHYPDIYFEYIIEKTLDVSEDKGYYHVKAELTIPSGTSFSKEDTVTNATGIAKGLAPVNPILLLVPLSDEIKIHETISGQSLMMKFTDDYIGETVEIDCENRTAKLLLEDDETYDLSVAVDMGSDWFRLQGEYSFDTEECVLQSITFNERR